MATFLVSEIVLASANLYSGLFFTPSYLTLAVDQKVRSYIVDMHKNI